MIKRFIVMLVLVGALFAGLSWFINFRAGIIKNALASLANPPQTVATTMAKRSDWQPNLAAIGTFRAVKGADLAIEVSGIVDQINFQSGDVASAEQTLLVLRKEPDVAKLVSLQAVADGYAITLKRDQGQLKINAVSQATVDTDIVNQKNALAQVAQQQAIVDQKTLKAPFSGRLGIRSVDIGQFLTAGTSIVTLQAIDQLFLDFMLPQNTLDQVKVGQKLKARVDAFPDMTFNGIISALNSKVDQASRNMQIRAVFDNDDHRLLPGMYASIVLDTGQPTSLVTLPQAAIVFNPYGNSVFLAVRDKQTNDSFVARQTFVKTGATRGDQIAILSGIEEGATVVTAGQIKLRNGTALKIDNSVELPNDPDPVPTDQ